MIHQIKFSLTCLLFVFVFLSGCNKKDISVTIRSDAWPDGTNISIISNGVILTESKLYGGRLRLSIPENIEFSLHAASLDNLTYVSKITNSYVAPDDIILPHPVKRFRYGSWRFGIVDKNISHNTLYSTWFVEADGFYSLTIPLLNNPGISSQKFHSRELIASLPLSLEMLTNYSALCDSAVLYGVDGLLLAPEPSFWKDVNEPTLLSGMVSEIHDRGMSCDIRFELSLDEAIIEIPGILQSCFSEKVTTMQADELRIAFDSERNPSIETYELIEKKILSLNKMNIPLFRISIELKMKGLKFKVDNNQNMMSADLAVDEIDDYSEIVGKENILRLSDTSLRFGYGGAIYVFDDYIGMADKISRLRQGTLRKFAGVHITFDASCISPKPGDIELLSKSVLK